MGLELARIRRGKGYMKKYRSMFVFSFILTLGFGVFLILSDSAGMKNVSAQVNKLSNVDTNDANWIGSWATSPQPPYSYGVSNEGFQNKTVRLIVNPHLDGEALRIRLSNTFGSKPLTFSEVYVGASSGEANIAPGTNHQVTFGGEKSVTIPIGEEIVSDPVALQVFNERDLAVSVYVPDDSGPATWHLWSQQTTYVADGNHATDTDASSFNTQVNSWFWLVGVDVIANHAVKGAIVTLGDSITDASHSTLNTNRRWPDFLAKRINEGPLSQRMSVLNAGISGNKILEDSPTGGISALERLERDVFSQIGVTDIVLLEGINDIMQNPGIRADEIISGMEQIIRRSYAHGLNIYGGTIMPFKGTSSYSAQTEQTRQAVNHWIRMSGAFDGVIDFDKALSDPEEPLRLLPKYDPGDHLHPNDAGTQAMADAVDLSMFYRENLGPKTWVDLSTSGFVQPGATMKVKANFHNLDEKKINGVKLSLDVPKGWHIQEDTQTEFTEVEKEEQVTAVFLVTSPDELEQDFYDIIAHTDFHDQSGDYVKKNMTTVQVLPNAITKTSWLSDLEWISAKNGWGSVERDMSNGEQASGDGNTLTINGETFKKGLGVHAPSEIVYFLGGNVAKFQSKIGVDDEMSDASPSSIVFQVWGDGKKLYDSGLMTARDDAKTVDVNVEGIELLKLVVTDGGNGNASDHGDWADAKFIVTTSASVEEIASLVKQFEEEGEFGSDDAARSLNKHLTAVAHYEQQEAVGKVVKHLKSFKVLLDYQLDKQLISDKVYKALQAATDELIQKWQ